MITFEAKKMDSCGRVRTWNYILKECLLKNQDLRLRYGADEMVIPVTQIKERALKLDNIVYTSKYPTSPHQTYTAYYFDWKSTKKTR